MNKLYLSQKDKKIAGICGGLAEAFELDSSLVRMGVVFVGLATAVFPLFFTYLLGWLIIPVQPQIKT